MSTNKNLKITKRRLMKIGVVVPISGFGSWWLFLRSDPDPLDNLPEEIDSAEFDWGEIPTREIDENTPPSEKPIINFDSEENEVYVEGVLTYGSSTCNAITVEKLNFENEKNTLHISVGWVEEGNKTGLFTGSCTDDLDHKPYSVTLGLESTLPNIVEAVENHFDPTEDDDTRVVTNRIEYSE
ncbi:hypothetical protein [Halosolutus gelatinilyticus]|uniref:hypothetical protein n=1 Tax=Halosolutus gelatinilyticus TaxID=2931975 RepID=UPI001FF6797C|nr:hypothetical protein [Halosolutus gelatinilyticus]